MLKLRKIIAILASISLAGCITYPNDGYFYSPNVNSYYGDGYYGNNNDYYDDDYYGNFGQYQYYGVQPSITFNFFSYGYTGYYPYYGYNSGYNNYRPCNAWSSYCYAYRPSYGWGYWPVYVYRPPNHHHHNDDHYGNNNGNHNNDNHNGNHQGNNNGNQQNQAIRETGFIGRGYANRQLTRPNASPVGPVSAPTPPIENGNNPYVQATPAIPVNSRQRYRAPNNTQQPIQENRNRNQQQPVPENDRYYGAPTYSIQQPSPEQQQRAMRNRTNRDDINQHDGAPNETVQQPRPEQQQRQRQNSNADRNNYVAPQQPVQIARSAPSNYNVQIPQQAPVQASQPSQPRVEKSERRESKKSNADDDE